MGTTPRPPADWREWRRLRTWDLAVQGWRVNAIARILGASPAAVRRRLATARREGPPKMTMLVPEDPVVPVEIIAEWSDRQHHAADCPARTLLPGEGPVECVIIHEFSDDCRDANGGPGRSPPGDAFRQPEGR